MHFGRELPREGIGGDLFSASLVLSKNAISESKDSSRKSIVSLGHSGKIVQMNANAILADRGITIPNLSVQGVGGAVSAEDYTRAG